MAKFIYKAKKGPNDIVERIIEADNKKSVLDKLFKNGYVPVRVEEYKNKSVSSKTTTTKKRLKKPSSKVKSRDLTILTSQLASLVKAKVSIIEAIEILYQQSQKPILKNILLSIKEKIKKGANLSEALSNYPEVFSPLYINIVKAGEAGGVLENSLMRLASFREQEDQMRAKINSALAYPVFIVFVGIAVVMVLLTFVVPKLTSLFGEIGQELPLPTKILISFTGVLRNYWYILAVIVVLAVWKIKKLVMNNKEVVDKLKLKIPLLGTIIKKRELERFTNTSKVLLASGIPVFEAIDIASLTLDNQLLKTSLAKVQKEVVDGAQIGKSLKRYKIFPSFMSDMISVGEKGGMLDMALSEISDFYQQDVERALKTVTSLLEPITILLMGLVIGFIVFAMLLPIFELNVGM
jgi:type II secretory pathway component PulF